MKYSLHNFEAGLEHLGIQLSERQMEQFLLFYEYLLEKNQVMNLTAVIEWEDVVQKHFLDSLSLVKAVDLKQNIRLIDVGTGAGFPGIPLKIAFPQLEITLMDSLNKRVIFLEETVKLCGLEGICAIHSRAEDLAREEAYRESYDLCVSRAVANLSTLSEYCLPFVKTGGQFISYKSGETAEELKGAERALEILGGTLREEIKFSLPNSDIARTLVAVDKVRPCGKKYPRKAGTAKKEPL